MGKRGVKPKPLVDKFWKNVDVCEANKCWLWKLCTVGKGYGYLGHKGRNLLAHRVAWMLTYGPIPEGMCVCHHCDVKLCCNPEHLFLGTIADNNADMARKGRYFHPTGEKHPRHKLTEEIVLMIRQRYAMGDITQQRLADEYGVDDSTVSRIVNCHRWKHV